MAEIFRGIFGTVSTLGHQAGAFSLLEERERMRTNWILTTAVMAMSVTAAVGAQSAKAMHQPSKGDAMSVAYTGCVESVNHGGAFLLTKIDSVDSMHDDKTMKHHDDMAMKSDAAKAMQHEQAPVADEKMDTMSAKSFALAGSANLSKHIGQKVSVTGSLSDGSMGTMRQDLSTLTIKTLKVIAKSCS
jgi:hypothetical protein